MYNSKLGHAGKKSMQLKVLKPLPLEISKFEIMQLVIYSITGNNLLFNKFFVLLQ